MSHTILIAEDELIVRENLKILLSEEGYNVITAENGSEAYNLLKENPVDILLTDVLMPEMDGFELVAKLRERQYTKFLPIIFITARTADHSRRLGMNAGADDYLTKPFKTEDVLNAVRTKLERKKDLDEEISYKRMNFLQFLPHELRTPLFPILGYSDLLLEDIESYNKDEIIEIMRKIKFSGLRLSDRIEKCLMYTEIREKIKKREEHRQSVVNGDYTDIDTIDWHKNFNLSHEWGNRKSDIQIDLEPASVRIEKEYLEFIIRELVENASKFSEKGSVINLVGKKHDDNYALAATNNGKDFNNYEVQKINPFVQFKREVNQQIGNGLGLSIVKEMMDLVDGRFKVKNESGVNVIVQFQSKNKKWRTH